MNEPNPSPVAARPRAPRNCRVAAAYTFAGVIVLAAVAVYVLGVRSLQSPQVGFAVPWLVVAALSAAADRFGIPIQLKRDSYTSSLSEVPLVVGLVLTNPAGLVLARIVGPGIALVLHVRQAGVKLVFNMAQEALTACTALVVFHALLGSHAATGPWGWCAALVAVMVIDVLSPLLIVSVVSVYEARPQWTMLPRLLTLDVLAGATNTCLGLVAVLVLQQDARAACLLLVIATIVHLAYRGYASLSQRYARLELLYGFTRALGTSVQPESILQTMLVEARDLLHAETAELVLFGDRTVRARLGSGDNVLTDAMSGIDPDAWWQPAASGDAVRAPRGSRDDGVRTMLERAGLKDAMAAPLRLNAQLVGVLMVINRVGDVATFTTDDLLLFETLANHATISLENGRLVQRLQQEAADKDHQALHDALTGLPNRRLFQRKVEQALSEVGETTRHLAVLLMDLDRFKDVNDTLGHHTGDVLLREVGQRLTATLAGRGTIARLGGDEFAALLPSVVDAQHAARMGEELVRSLEQPFTLDELIVEVGASVGVTLAPDHGDDAAALLQRADIAMYEAKAATAGVRVYEPVDDRYTRRRLSLVGELRQAVAERELVVHYQPKLALATGEVTGVEALVRWIHPVHGFLPPDEFIPLAEQSGLVRPLTTFVLGEALMQCAAWRREGRRLCVAVNLSVRSLLDPSLPDEVAVLLSRAGVPADALTLEITESSIMTDQARSAGVLDRLHEMGVTLSIDDFGTGYSSLSYLKRLPVGEVKIDKSFVMGMASNDNDAAIVEAIVVLGQNLGLQVVAEGVESPEIRDRLARLGCDGVQGYLFSRPLPAADLEHWFSDQRLRAPVRG